MKLQFSPADEAFRLEVREFVKQPPARRHPAQGRTRPAPGARRLRRPGSASSRRAAGSRPAGRSSTAARAGTTCSATSSTRRRCWAARRASSPAASRCSAPCCIAFGTDEQKRKYLPDIRQSNTWWAQGFSEPGAGSDLAAVRTTAVLEPDGKHFVVNGHKVWTSYAQWCSMMFALVRTDPDAAKPQEGISFLLIDMNSPGIDRASDPDARRRQRPQRVLSRQRARAGGEPGGRAAQGLVLRQVPAGSRAHRHRRHRLVQAAAGPGAPARRASKASATTPCCRRGWRNSKSS